MPRFMRALAVLMALATPCHAGEPKAFACNFTAGATHSYDKGEFAVEATAPLSFVIGAIDADAQTADLRNERGVGKLRIVRAVNAMHFLEVATEGYLHVTTVYDKDEAKGAYPAVHSRHFGLFGQPIVTQYQGFCEELG